MTNNEEQIQEIEVSMAEAKKVLALGEALKRLQRDPDYKLVVSEEYFKEEASRLTMLTAEPNFDEVRKANVQAAIRGIGELRQFLMIVERNAEMAREAIYQAEQALVEIDNDLGPDEER